MPKTVEDEFKVDTWLSILTYDVVKYIAAGGSVHAEISGDDLLLRLTGVNPEGMHGKFKRLLSADVEAAATPSESVESEDV